jgi:hypothetical protein
MDFGVYLLHGDGERAFAIVEDGTCGLGEQQWIDEGWKLQRVEHGRGLARGVRPG